ncbi:MAG: TrmH family RNA methyltransferase, partial [Bacteroidota bacterium]
SSGSASASKWVERREHPSIVACYSALRSEGFAIYATRIAEGAVSLYGLDLTGKVALVVGNEHRGVSDDAARGADALVQIPMFGMIQSLNVSVASAVMLFEAARQRIGKSLYAGPRFGEEELQTKLEEWSGMTGRRGKSAGKRERGT